MTITNQTNPVGSEYTSKKNGINVPKELISGPGRTQATKIFTAVRITKTKKRIRKSKSNDFYSYDES